MKFRTIAKIAALLMAGAAQAATPPPSYAVIALVGDKLDIVTYQPQIGSQLNTNTHTVLPLSQDDLDLSALRAINRSLREAAPGAQVILLMASTPGSFADQEHIFSGSRVTLPAEVDAAVRREGAGMLVLVTKHRGDARLAAFDGHIGGGKLEGMGYFIDTQMEMKDIDTAIRSTGFLAPFVYIDVSLVDLATSVLVQQKTIMSGEIVTASPQRPVVHPWDALSSQEKLAKLQSILDKELQRVVPLLIAPAATKAE